jgi:hypothetical protein
MHYKCFPCSERTLHDVALRRSELQRNFHCDRKRCASPATIVALRRLGRQGLRRLASQTALEDKILKRIVSPPT